MKLVISGASGKTGYRIAQEAISKGWQVRLLVRTNSELPSTLNRSKYKKYVVSLADKQALDAALEGCDALVIATGARPSIDLTGPARVDALGVSRQIESCKRSGVKRVVLVSSLCAGQWIHPLNLFGLILIWKRIGEQVLEKSGLDWTVIRPGGLNEREDDIQREGIKFTGPDLQKDAYIPRRLVAKSCIEALQTPSSINRIIEVTSSKEIPKIKMSQAIKEFPLSA